MTRVEKRSFQQHIKWAKWRKMHRDKRGKNSPLYRILSDISEEKAKGENPVLLVTTDPSGKKIKSASIGTFVET